MSKAETQHDGSHENTASPSMEVSDFHSKRREFLRGSALLGAGAAVVAGAPTVAASTTEEASVEATPETKPKGYRLTKHIAAYYRTAAS